MKGEQNGEARIPRHVAIIMDGNGRWAKRRFLPRGAGHRAGMNRMIPLVEHIFTRGVKFVTLYALSTENLSRPKEELEGLFALLREYFFDCTEKLKRKGIRLKIIGERNLLPEDIALLIERGETETASGESGTLFIAVAYGSRQEIVRAANKALASAGEITAETLSEAMDTGDAPDPDLLIRTGKETRLSNFLLWQSAYTELYFSDKMFPAFQNKDFDRALADYAKRNRRFGKV
ncbi:MAG: polyprenyl diphosphate synthase [Candidatus Gallimonas sp.]